MIKKETFKRDAKSGKINLIFINNLPYTFIDFYKNIIEIENIKNGKKILFDISKNFDLIECYSVL